MRVRDPLLLHSAITQSGFSRAEVARRAGVDKTLLSKLLPPLNNLSAIANRRSCSNGSAVGISRALGWPVRVLFVNRLPSDPSTGELPAQGAP